VVVVVLLVVVHGIGEYYSCHGIVVVVALVVSEIGR